MKVLFISSWEIGVEEGKVSFIYEQIEQLKLHVKAQFITINFKSRLKNLSIKRDSLKKRYDWEGVTYYEYTFYRLPTWITRRTQLEDFELAARILATKLKSNRPDLIHAHVVLPAGLIAITLGEKLNIPVVMQEHSAPFEMNVNSHEKKVNVEKVLNEATKVIAVGPELKQRMLPFIKKDNIVVIPNLLSTDLFSPQIKNIVEGKLKIVSVGGLVLRKGYDLLIKTVGCLRDRGVNIHLSIAGEGPEKDNLQKLIEALRLLNEVDLLGYVSRTELVSIYQQSNIYVHTSERETFGLGPAEALLCGIPVVTVKCEGPEHYINDNVGIIVKNRDIKTIADSIQYVYSNLACYKPDRLNKYVVDKFGEKVFVRNILSTYDSILN